MRAWVALERGAPVRNLRPWLYRIVHNCTLNTVRASPDAFGPLEEASGIGAPAGCESEIELRLMVRTKALPGAAGMGRAGMAVKRRNAETDRATAKGKPASTNEKSTELERSR